MFDGHYLTLHDIGDGLLQLSLCRQDGGENVLNESFLDELTTVMAQLESASA